MVKNKKAWLRIIEATLAVLIILSAFLILYSSQKVESVKDPSDQISTLLNYIANNDSLRNEILNNDTNVINDLNLVLNNNLDSSKLNYTLKLCSINQSCDPSLNNFDKKSNIYSSERIISTNLTLDNLDRAKRIRVFYWEIA